MAQELFNGKETNKSINPNEAVEYDVVAETVYDKF
jgi:hypothetical protein